MAQVIRKSIPHLDFFLGQANLFYMDTKTHEKKRGRPPGKTYIHLVKTMIDDAMLDDLNRVAPGHGERSALVREAIMREVRRRDRSTA